MDVSPKFHEYLQFTSRVMDVDNSVLGVTGWNDHRADPVSGNLYIMRQHQYSTLVTMTNREMFTNV